MMDEICGLYCRHDMRLSLQWNSIWEIVRPVQFFIPVKVTRKMAYTFCLLYTSDAADE